MGPSVARSPHQTWRLAASGMLRGLGEPQGHRADSAGPSTGSPERGLQPSSTLESNQPCSE